MEKGEQLLTAKQVAVMLQVHVNTLHNWDKSGKLKAMRIGGGDGYMRYRKEDIEKFINTK
jgi:excisionase family DNA binding protein